MTPDFDLGQKYPSVAVVYSYKANFIPKNALFAYKKILFLLKY